MGDWLMQGLCDRSSRDICVEMQRASMALSWTAIEALIDQGVDHRHLAMLTGGGDIGRMRVEFGRDGYWNPIDVGGVQALILPVMDGAILVDLVAFSPRTPDIWALRRGDGRILGHGDSAADWDSGVSEIRIFATPMEWVIAGGEGICVLTWDERAIRDLAALGGRVRLMADSHALAAHIEEQMKSVPILPDVGVQPAQIMMEAAE